VVEQAGTCRWARGRPRRGCRGRSDHWARIARRPTRRQGPMAAGPMAAGPMAAAGQTDQELIAHPRLLAMPPQRRTGRRQQATVRRCDRQSKAARPRDDDLLPCTSRCRDPGPACLRTSSPGRPSGPTSVACRRTTGLASEPPLPYPSVPLSTVAIAIAIAIASRQSPVACVQCPVALLPSAGDGRLSLGECRGGGRSPPSRRQPGPFTVVPRTGLCSHSCSAQRAGSGSGTRFPLLPPLVPCLVLRATMSSIVQLSWIRQGWSAGVRAAPISA
jgi:hypothetical protein